VAATADGGRDGPWIAHFDNGFQLTRIEGMEVLRPVEKTSFNNCGSTSAGTASPVGSGTNANPTKWLPGRIRKLVADQLTKSVTHRDSAENSKTVSENFAIPGRTAKSWLVQAIWKTNACRLSAPGHGPPACVTAFGFAQAAGSRVAGSR